MHTLSHSLQLNKILSFEIITTMQTWVDQLGGLKLSDRFPCKASRKKNRACSSLLLTTSLSRRLDKLGDELVNEMMREYQHLAATTRRYMLPKKSSNVSWYYPLASIHKFQFLVTPFWWIWLGDSSSTSNTNTEMSRQTVCDNQTT